MVWTLANPWMLAGLAGVAIPILIHLLNRRRVTVIDWGAMQFLEIGRRARRRIQIADWLLMAVRMVLLALVALALAQPLVGEPPAGASGVAGPSLFSSIRRDVVIVLDGSASMDRRLGPETPRARALAWAERFLATLPTGSTCAVLLARDPIRPLVGTLRYDLAAARAALGGVKPSRASSDIPAALAEAFRILEEGRNPARDVIVLTDGQRYPWRPAEAERWALLRDVRRDAERRAGIPIALTALDFAGDAPVAAGADGAVGSLELDRSIVPPLLPLEVRATVANAGPGPLSRTVELLVDGEPVPGLAQVVGPLPPGGRAPVVFQATLADPGSHVLSVRLAPGDDPLSANDRADRPVEVTAALPVLLVDGDPGREPLSSEADYLSAALSPSGDSTPQVAAEVVRLPEFGTQALRGKKVAVLANVDRLDAAQQAALTSFLGEGGGVLVAIGDRIDAEHANAQWYRDGAGWLPARVDERRGDPARRQAVAHPAPASFQGRLLARFAQEDNAPLAEADLFTYRVLVPAQTPPAAVLARLDTGDPWIVERASRRGRVMVLAGSVDAEAGTLPVNPDFVPWAHEIAYHLADREAEARTFRAGEPVAVELDPAPPEGVSAVDVTAPDGTTNTVGIERSGGAARLRLAGAGEPGAYRVRIPGSSGASDLYLTVAADDREWDAQALSAEDRAALSDGWPLTFAAGSSDAAGLLAAGRRPAPRSLWRPLVLAALAGLCLEVLLTRSIVRSRGVAGVSEED